MVPKGICECQGLPPSSNMTFNFLVPLVGQLRQGLVVKLHGSKCTRNVVLTLMLFGPSGPFMPLVFNISSVFGKKCLEGGNCQMYKDQRDEKAEMKLGQEQRQRPEQ